MKPTIVRTIQRPDAEAVGTLWQLGVATTHEAQGRTGLMRPYMRPICGTAKVAGAMTVSCRLGDNPLIHAALELCQPGVAACTNCSWAGLRRKMRWRSFMAAYQAAQSNS